MHEQSQNDPRNEDEQPEAAEQQAEQPAAQPADAPGEQDDAAQELRSALGEMRAEADRIAELGTGPDQVEAAERFAEGAGRLDEQIGAAARAADDDERR